MKSKIVIVMLILALVMLISSCNVKVIDTVYNYDRAIVVFPDGKSVEGEIKKLERLQR